MPSWFINTLLLEAAGFILMVAGCFVAGMVSEAREICAERAMEKRREEDERKREAELKKQSSMLLGDTNESAWEFEYPSYGTVERK